ncbi:MAG TPA: hypothetical protein QF549_02160 [Candidatus Saccharimonadaceae bacterium]|nr:hypothetical protein [Candidatus Saccharimonadaceae bacterium]
MSAAVAPTHHLSLVDGSTLIIGRIDGGYAVLSCQPGAQLKPAIDEHRGELPVERITERLRLLGPHPGDRYIPTDNSPIEIRLQGDDGTQVTLFNGMTADTARIVGLAPR